MLNDRDPAPVPSLPRERPRVLVIDDEYGPRESIAFSLSAEFEVDTAGRAREGLEKLRAQAFAVVVLDIRMPEMDGIRALEELRKIDPHVSVIMLTGYGTLQTAQQAIVGGANQYLRKPPDIPELLAAVRRQAEATQQRRAEAEATRAAQAMNVALKREIAENEPQIWHGRASVELVHDLNNPLSAVIVYAGVMLDEATELGHRDPEATLKLMRYSVLLSKAAEYCQHLSEHWRQASRHTPNFQRLDIVAVGEEVRRVIFFNNPALVLTGETEAWVRGSRFELMRVFQNLFKNAMEAGASEVRMNCATRGGEVEVAVADNGPGMDEALVRRVLKGGYTNKASGTGLGVSICRHLVGAHGGTFHLESEVGRGTTIRLLFPALPRE